MKSSAKPSVSQPVTTEARLTGTNTFDTVSKRSVERLYRPSEPQYLRHFVKKPQRRSPVFNRLFWLRTKAIEDIVHAFLSTHGKDTRKAIINMGCGSDVLPWRMNNRSPDTCEDTCFIDVDFPGVMQSKRDTIFHVSALKDLLGSDHCMSEADSDPLVLSSKKYCQVGCDFADIDTLRRVIKNLVSQETQVLVLAEMSMVFNDAIVSDHLIDWAKNELNAEFCLLEYCRPVGMNHPLAAQLLRAYEGDQTPLKALHTFPTITSQCQRFQKRGWTTVVSCSLWDVSVRMETHELGLLDKIEPFDDWEDLILLARHFLVLHAFDGKEQPMISGIEVSTLEETTTDVQINRYPLAKNPRRRFGALLQDTTAEGVELLISLMGHDHAGLSDSYNAMSFSEGEIVTNLPVSGPMPRSCFTTSDLGYAGILITGGKSNALNQPMKDCWFYVRGSCPRWKKTWDMPVGLHRHSAVRLGQSSLVLILGGRGTRGVSSESFLYHPNNGWRKCEVETSLKPSLFGASAWHVNSSKSKPFVGLCQGIICGGLKEYGAPNAQIYRWYLDITGGKARIKFDLLPMEFKMSHRLAVFGAQVVNTGTHVLLVGGIGSVSRTKLLGQSVLRLPSATQELRSLSVELFCPTNAEGQWPIMLGSSAAVVHDHLIIIGGGTVGYHSQTLWNDGIYCLKLDPNSMVSDLPAIRLLESPRMTTVAADLDTDLAASSEAATITEIPRVQLRSAEDFLAILKNRTPVIMEGLDFGSCLSKWTPQYLCDQVGSETQVTVHESISDSPRLDFNSKNFKYVTYAFGTVISKMKDGGRMYLRALSRSKPSDMPANLNDDFPSLAPDFRLPKELNAANSSLFSSILRLSGRANMWLHYDVMANVYTQIRGTKQMILFPPQDAVRLGFAPGASSSSFDVFSALGTEALAGTHPQEAKLGEGDALFLPAAWLHTAAPLTDMSVAVNVFFRDLDGGYADGRDVYGNRDLAAYEKGRQHVAKIAQIFRNLPHDMRQFYLSRIAEELRNMADTPQ